MRLKQYQVDAFASRPFEGNPAAVCPLECWLKDALLQAIAQENNLSETAFFVREKSGFRLRWFTPAAEVDLCGHATLASAFVLYEILGHTPENIRFETRSGPLIVSRNGALLSMDFPSTKPVPCAAPASLLKGLQQLPVAVFSGNDYLAVFDDQSAIENLSPDWEALKQLGLRGVIATAPGKDADFVSRCFYPKLGVTEDPVTGSAHCELAPYWSERFGKASLTGHQLSKRGGTVLCEIQGDRVKLSGTAVLFMTAEMVLPD